MKAIGRRQFGKIMTFMGLLATTGWSLALEGCASFASISSWIVTGLDSFQSVVDLLVGQGIIMVTIGSAIDLIIRAVKAAIADVGTAVDNYNIAPAASKATLVGKISVALVAAQNEIGQFWNDLMIPDAKVASTVAGLLGLIVSTLAGFQSLLPPAPASAVLRTFPKTLQGTAAQRYSLGQFKSKFNAILNANGFSNYRRF
jgi:hypothetical protein